ncbi:hypothetical protein FB45DRAFT_412599 [Roridomyces roridus]|uniref:Uncharacterized protein n=1 Tax=Roridomyces roridus TaxID=1738132 RepID=A0AAD7C6F9_9AGAR|nr:hypothetical protein FB45DRAFT_412599 [Roridomyces roridus]
MSSPTKRPITDETRSTAQASDASHASTPADLVAQLRNVGSRVRKNVSEGYNTHRGDRATSVPPSPTKPPQADIFTSANDVLRRVYGSPNQPRPPISPNKRRRQDDSDHESGDTNSADRKDDTESDGETDIVFENRPVRPRPRRRLMQTQSLPTNLFGDPSKSASHDMDAEESDWSIAASSSQPPAFEPMVL